MIYRGAKITQQSKNAVSDSANKKPFSGCYRGVKYTVKPESSRPAQSGVYRGTAWAN